MNQNKVAKMKPYMIVEHRIQTDRHKRRFEQIQYEYSTVVAGLNAVTSYTFNSDSKSNCRIIHKCDKVDIVYIDYIVQFHDVELHCMCAGT